MPFYPPAYKERVLVQLLQDIGQESPDRVFSVLARTDDLKDGFFDLTFRHANEAVDYIARWLLDNIGEPERQYETLTYFGIPDIRYTLLTLACIKAGYKALLPSFRNTTEVNASLMRQTRSTKILHSGEMKALSSIASVVEGAITFEIPSEKEVLEGKADPVPYEHPYEDALNHEIVVLHSSGSTGIPKPITYTNATVLTLGADWDFRPIDGRRIVGLPMFVSDGDTCRFFGPMPPFHLGGLYYKTVVPILSMGTPVYQPPGRLPSSDLVLEIMQSCKIQAVVLPPSLIEGLLHVPNGLEQLKRLDWIIFSGGPLAQTAGDEIAKYTTVIPYYGSTELLAVRQIVPEQERWSYLQFHPDDRFEMDHVSDGLYELVAFSDPAVSPNNAGSAAFYHSLPGTKTFRTSDLFRKHPTLDLWQFVGRRDDIIVLSSGEKINPVQTESAMSSDAAVTGALVFGFGHPRPGMLIEVKPGMRDNSDLRGRISTALQKANQNASGPAQVSEALIVISDPARPFVRTGKGTVVRKLTIELYKEEISALYGKSTQAVPSIEKTVFDKSKATLEDVRELVRSTVTRIFPGTPESNEANLYLLGMDSLMTADISAELSRRLGRPPWMLPRICYANPNIEALSSAIFDRLHQPNGTEVKDNNRTRQAEIKEMIQKYAPSSQDLKTSFATKEHSLKDHGSGRRQLTVVITGTTGNLGHELVSAFAGDDRVHEIICLNRSRNAQQVWSEKSRAEKNTAPVITFKTVVFDKPALDLNAEDAHRVQAADVFVHNAWKVDFNQDLASFEDNLIGLHNIINVCRDATHPPHLALISSISVAAQLDRVLESSVDDLAASIMGYGDSKLAAEHILNSWVRSTPNLHASVLRVGQIAGSSLPGHTPWPQTEAFPALFRTCRSLKLVPDDLAAVKWIPIDVVARSVHELSMIRLQSPKNIAYFNVVNPQLTAWSDLIEPLRQFCGSEVKTTPLSQWVDLLKTFDRTDKVQLESMPALKTVEFFETLAQGAARSQDFSTSDSVAASQTLAQLKAIDVAMFERWLREM